VAAAATVDEIAASSSSFEIREPVNTSAPLSQSSEDDDVAQPGLNPLIVYFARLAGKAFLSYCRRQGAVQGGLPDSYF